MCERDVPSCLPPSSQRSSADPDGCDSGEGCARAVNVHTGLGHIFRL